MPELTTWLDNAPKDERPSAHGELAVKSERVADHAQLLRILDDFRGTGWVCVTDEVVPVFEPGAWTGPSGNQRVLSAELVSSSSRDTSLHVRRGSDGWLVTKFAEREGEGPMLAWDSRILSSESGKKMRYRTWWQLEEGEVGIRVWTPLAARFMGWEDVR